MNEHYHYLVCFKFRLAAMQVPNLLSFKKVFAGEEGYGDKCIELPGKISKSSIGEIRHTIREHLKSRLELKKDPDQIIITSIIPLECDCEK